MDLFYVLPALKYAKDYTELVKEWAYSIFKILRAKSGFLLWEHSFMA